MRRSDWQSSTDGRLHEPPFANSPRGTKRLRLLLAWMDAWLPRPPSPDAMCYSVVQLTTKRDWSERVWSILGSITVYGMGWECISRPTLRGFRVMTW